METIDIYKELTGHFMRDADEIYRNIEHKLISAGLVSLKLIDNSEIKNIKAIGKWGNGLFYGFTEGQQNFSNSVSLFDIRQY